eukprot:scaffold45383_cov214-Amphora_coffeaeformis.AAC.1
MGHQPWVYRGTSWWNSSGPKTVASALKCPCVCIRHRGAYVHLPDWFALLSYNCLLLLPLGIIGSALLWWYSHDQAHWMALLSIPLALLFIGVFLKWTARGSANMDDMVHDVATAIAWVQQNKDRIFPNSSIANAKKDHQMIFGGYSSGAHVSATLLQRPTDYWKQHGLPPPDKLFAAIMYISGVLATQPLSNYKNDESTTTPRKVFSSRSNSSSRGSNSHVSRKSTSVSSEDDDERQKEAS